MFKKNQWVRKAALCYLDDNALNIAVDSSIMIEGEPGAYSLTQGGGATPDFVRPPHPD